MKERKTHPAVVAGRVLTAVTMFAAACAENASPTTGIDGSENQSKPTEVLPDPGVGKTPGKTVEPEPTQITTPTTETISTQEVFPGASDSSFLAVFGVPEGFGGTGEISELVNNQQIQDNLNRQGYAPVANGGGVLSRTQSQDGLEVCNSNLPDKLYNPDVPSEEDTRIASESGIVSYGDSETGEIRVKAVGVVSTAELPDEWDCLNAVVIDEENPAGWGALRTLVIDGEGNIKVERPAAYAGTDNLEVRWENSGPKLYVNGNAVNFTFREEVQPTEVEPTPTEEVKTPAEIAETLGWISETQYIPGVEREYSQSENGNFLVETRKKNDEEININVAKWDNESENWLETSLNEKYADILSGNNIYVFTDHETLGLINVAEGNSAYRSFELRGVVTGEKESVSWIDPSSGEELSLYLIKVAMLDKLGKALELDVFIGAEEHNNGKRFYYNEKRDDGKIYSPPFYGTVEEIAEELHSGDVVKLTIPFIRPANERPYSAQCYETLYASYCTEPEQTEYYLFKQFGRGIQELKDNLWYGTDMSLSVDELIVPTDFMKVFLPRTGDK